MGDNPLDSAEAMAFMQDLLDSATDPVQRTIRAMGNCFADGGEALMAGEGASGRWVGIAGNPAESDDPAIVRDGAMLAFLASIANNIQAIALAVRAANAISREAPCDHRDLADGDKD